MSSLDTHAPASHKGLHAFLAGLPGVDQVCAEARATALGTRSIKKDSKFWAINTAISMVDLTTLEGADPKTLRDTLDRIKQRLGTGVIVLATVRDDKVNLIAGVTDDLTAQVKAGDLIGFVASQVGGKGGGRADMAQAGGTNPASLPAALASVQQWLTEQLA